MTLHPGGVLGWMLRKAGRVLWILDHWEDVVSDLSVFHRVDPADPDAAVARWSSQRFFSIVQRLPHYRGTLRDVVLNMQQPPEQRDTKTTPAGAITPKQTKTGLPAGLAQFVDT